MLKPIANHWYAIKPLDPQILWIREIHVDPYVAGDIWLLRGAERDLVVDTGTGIVPPAPVIEALTAKPVVAIALNCYFDHGGGWHITGGYRAVGIQERQLVYQRHALRRFQRPIAKASGACRNFRFAASIRATMDPLTGPAWPS